MTQVPLAPPPPTKDPGLDRWLWLLWRRLTQAGQFLWSSLDFTGSNLTDLATRNHADLQNIDTASYTHLTATQATDLTDGGATTLHKHDHGAMDGLSDDDHTQYLLAAGTRALSADWDAGSFEIRALTFESDVANGTAPLVVASTTKVANLNSDYLDDQTGSYYLDSANFTGTNWTDLTDGGATTLHKHDHAAQDNLNSTNYTHLTAANHTDLTDAGDTTLHYHAADRARANHTGTQALSTVLSDTLGSPTAVTTLKDLINYSWSAGAITGCAVTDNGDGTVAVAAGEGVLRTSATATADLKSLVIPAMNPVSLTNNDANYIYADYASGTPTVAVTTDINGFNCMDKCIIAAVSREDTHLHIIDLTQQSVDGNRKYRRRSIETEPYKWVPGGTILGTSSRYMSLTAGAFWFALDKETHGAFDTSVADTISTYYRATPSGWTKTTGVTQFPNTQYDDDSGTLATLGNNKFGVHWLFIALGSTPHLALVYGQAEYATAAAASLSQVPATLPPVFEATTVLVGRIIFEKSAVSATSTDSAFYTVFSSGAVTQHNNMSGLQGGTIGEYYHFTAAQATDLTDGGDSTAHAHFGNLSNLLAFAAAQG